MEKINSLRRNSFARGFTLIELMLVIIILAILMLIAFYGIRYYILRASEMRAQQAVGELQTALRLYKDDNEDDVYPIEVNPGGRSIVTSLQKLVDYEYLPDNSILQQNPSIIYATTGDGGQYWLAYPIQDQRNNQITTTGNGVYATDASGGTDTIATSVAGGAVRFSNPERVDSSPNNATTTISINNPLNTTSPLVYEKTKLPNDSVAQAMIPVSQPGDKSFYNSPGFSVSFWAKLRKPSVSSGSGVDPLLLKRVVYTSASGCTVQSGCPLTLLGGGWQVSAVYSAGPNPVAILRINGYTDNTPLAPTTNLNYFVPGSYPTNAWHHITLTQSSDDNSPVRVYINGALAGTSPGTISLNSVVSAFPLAYGGYPSYLLGWGPNPGTQSYFGSESDFDDLRLYSTDLPLSRVQTLYNGGKGVPGSSTEPDAVAGWSFDEAPGENDTNVAYSDYVGYFQDWNSTTRTSNTVTVCRSSKTTLMGCTADSLSSGIVPLAIRGIISPINRGYVVSGR